MDKSRPRTGSRPTMPTANPPISVIDYAEFTALEDQLQKQRGPTSKQGYETWERYDSSIRQVMRRHGKSAGWDADVDFYHGGDWFHELYNGFALMKTTALSPHLLHELQAIVAQHHSNAVLSLGGEMDTAMQGLEILITPNAIYATWYEESADTCRRKIEKAGVQIF